MHVDVTLSREDHRRVQRAAGAASETVAAWVRRAIRGALEPRAEHQEQLATQRELGAFKNEIRVALRAVVQCVATAEAVAGKATAEQRERFAEQLLDLYEERSHKDMHEDGAA